MAKAIYKTCHICGRRRSMKYLERVGKGVLKWERFQCIEGGCAIADGVTKLMKRLGVRDG